MKHFTKPALTLTEQVCLLKSRGLIVPDDDRAERYLQYISYYRLVAYGKPYHLDSGEDHIFLPGTRFDDILSLYIFDRKLRLHVMDAIERIEVAVRAVVNNHMSLAYSQYWYMDRTLFASRFDHDDFLSRLHQHTKNGRHPFCKAYHEKYSYPVLPPSWMVSEVLDFGVLSKIYASLSQPRDKKAVADSFSLPYKTFESWLWSLNILRNTCAHHGLVWNRVFTHSPRLDPKCGAPTPHHFYARAIVIWQLLVAITRHPGWLSTLKEILGTCPRSISEMGFPDGWQLHPCW